MIITKSPLEEEQRKLLKAIAHKNLAEVANLAPSWYDLTKDSSDNFDDIWQLHIEPVFRKLANVVDIIKVDGEMRAIPSPQQIFDTVLSTISGGEHIQGCFTGILNSRKQENGSPNQDSDDEDNESRLDEYQDKISRSINIIDSETEKLKWEAIALLLVKTHSEHLTPRIPKDPEDSEDLEDDEYREQNNLHQAVEDSLTTVVKQLITNIQELNGDQEDCTLSKNLMILQNSANQHCLELALGNETLSPNIICQLIQAESSLIYPSKKNNVEKPSQLHLFIQEITSRALDTKKNAKPMPSTEDCCQIVKSIIEAKPGYVLAATWGGLDCVLIKGGVEDKVTPYQLISRIKEAVGTKLGNDVKKGLKDRLLGLKNTLNELQIHVETLIFRHLEGSCIQKAGFDQYNTEIDLSDFDTLDSKQPSNDLSVFVKDFKPNGGSFRLPQRLARLDLPDMSFGSSKVNSSIKLLFENLGKFNVGKIMRLYAKDNLQEPIPDDTIADWVSKFHVETLDWRKIDMDISHLIQMAEQAKLCLRTITLYTNGHQGVLYHWFSDDGLFRLYGLNKATIYVVSKQNTPEEQSKAEIIIERAKCLLELKKVRAPTIDISFQRASKSGRLSRSTDLTLNKRFFEPIGSIHRALEKEFDEARKKKVWHTKIAIIDNGISYGLSTVWDNIIKGESTHFNVGTRVAPWYTSRDPHGTHMASLITQLNPACGLLIYRINSFQHDIKIATAVAGIEMARKELKHRADILNLSWSFNHRSKTLEDALKVATEGDNPMLVFCAKSDEPYAPNVWPADFDTTISVASASTITTVLKFDKPPDIVIYDEDMGVESPTYAVKKDKVVSGSSVATALASGIASLILTIARLEFRDRHWQLLKNRENMLSVFEGFKINKTNPILFVDPAELFRDLKLLRAKLEVILLGNKYK